MNQEEINLEEFYTLEILEKLSEKHISFNKRLVELNVHLLSYYSDIPPYFNTKRLIPPNQQPKQGVQVLNIQQIDKDDENTRKLRRPNVFRIVFDKKHLIDFKKSGKETAQLKEKFQYNYNNDNEQQSQQVSLNVSKLTDKSGKADQKKNKIQWVFQCKTAKERDNWKLLKEQIEFEQRDEKSKNIDTNYISQKSVNGYNSNYQHPNHQNYQSRMKTQMEYQTNGYSNQQNIYNNLFKIDEEDRNDKYLNSIDNNELAISHENSQEINRSQSSEIKMSYGNNSLNNRSIINKGMDSPTKIQSIQQLQGNHFNGEIMSQEEERDQNENQKKRQDLRQYSMNQHYENLLPSNHVKQTESTLFQNKQSYNEDEEDKFKQFQKKEEEMRKRALDEEEERKKKEKEEVERIKKQKEEEEQRIKNKLVYDSSYELQYQDQLNSTNLLQQVINENPQTINNVMNQSTQFFQDQSQQPQLIEPTTLKIPLSQFSNSSPNRREKIDDRFKKNYELLSLIGTFNEAAQEATKLLIEDLIFSGNLKKYFPIQIKKEYPNIEQLGQDIYFDMLPSYEFLVEAKRYNNFVIKLSWITQETIALTQNYQQNDNSIPSQFQEQLGYQDSSMGQMIERFINESPLTTTRQLILLKSN